LISLNKIWRFLLNQDEFDTNCAIDKNTKISVEIRISADIQKVKYRPIISVDRYIGRSVVCMSCNHNTNDASASKIESNFIQNCLQLIGEI